MGECGEERVRLGCCSFGGEQGGLEKGHLQSRGCTICLWWVVCFGWHH